MKQDAHEYTTLNAIYASYTFGIFVATVLSYLFARPLTVHGRETHGVSKFYYFVFYSLSVMLMSDSRTYFIIHPLRRLLETLIYSRRSKSKMTYLQLAHSLLYFTIVSIYLRDKPVEPIGFVIFNVIQAIAHFRVYVLKKYEFSHYFSEILIYGYVFYCVRTCAMFWNLAYVCAFVLVSIRNRRDLQNKV